MLGLQMNSIEDFFIVAVAMFFIVLALVSLGARYGY